MSPQPPGVIFGGTRFGNKLPFMPAASLDMFLAKLIDHGVDKIDTAQSYGNSQETLGHVRAAEKFIIDTKWSPPSFTEATSPWATKDNIIRSAQESIKKLGVKQVHKPRWILVSYKLEPAWLTVQATRSTYSISIVLTL